MPSDAFLGEVSLFAGPYAPAGSVECFGQILPIGQNSALFSLLGTTYGGDGARNFRLPDLRGAFPTGEQEWGDGSVGSGSDVPAVPVSMVIAVQGIYPPPRN